MKAERLAAGVYATADGALHLDITEMLEAVDMDDTPENRQTLIDAAHDAIRQKYPDMKVYDVD